MFKFNEEKFYSHVDRLSHADLLKEIIALRDMFNIRYLDSSPLIDLMGDMIREDRPSDRLAAEGALYMISIAEVNSWIYKKLKSYMSYLRGRRGNMTQKQLRHFAGQFLAWKIIRKLNIYLSCCW